MAALKHTPLRHRMLADTARRIGIGEGTANLYYPHYGGRSPHYARRSGPALPVGDRRALTDLDKAGLFLRMFDDAPSQMGRPLSLTPAGRALLAEWNEKHGNPLTEERE